MLVRALIPTPLYKADLDETTLAKLGPDAIPREGDLERPIPNVTKGRRRIENSSWIDWFYGPPDLKTIATNLVFRQCILNRAMYWASLLVKYGSNAQVDVLAADGEQQIKRLLVEIWELH